MGKVTQTREVTGDGVRSFVGRYTKRIPYGVIDSDQGVELGKTALASRYDPTRTKDPRIGLNFSQIDGSGPYLDLHPLLPANSRIRLRACRRTDGQGDAIQVVSGGRRRI